MDELAQARLRVSALEQIQLELSGEIEKLEEEVARYADANSILRNEVAAITNEKQALQAALTAACPSDGQKAGACWWCGK